MFFRDLFRGPPWVTVWVFVLMLVNVASVAFWNEPLARTILLAFMLSAMMMMALYSWFGFVKILGLGHVLWIPLLILVLARIPEARDGFRTYLIVLCVFNAISLAFDMRDIWRYFSLRTARRTPFTIR
jgi:hypothetical protein